MENFNAKEYRDNLAKDLKDIRKDNPEKAQEILASAKNTEEYQEAKKMHQENRDQEHKLLLQKMDNSNVWSYKDEIIKELIVKGYIDDANKFFYDALNDLKKQWLENPNVGSMETPWILDLVEQAKLLNLKDQTFYTFLKENIDNGNIGGTANEVLEYLIEVDEDPKVKEMLEEMLDRDKHPYTPDYHRLVTASILSRSGDRNIFKETLDRENMSGSRYHYLLDQFSEQKYLKDESILGAIEEKARYSQDWNVLGKIALYTKNHDLAKEAILNSLKLYKADEDIISSLEKKSDEHVASVFGRDVKSWSSGRFLMALRSKGIKKEELLKSRPDLNKLVNIESYLDQLRTIGLDKLALEIENLK